MRQRKWLLIVLVFAMLVSMPGMFAEKVQAASKAAYKELQFYSDEGPKTILKCGKYYLKDKDGMLSISTKKNSGYKKTPIPTVGTFSNGTNAYYIKEQILYKYNFKSRKEREIENLASLVQDKDYMTEVPYFRISKIYNHRIYITSESFEDWQYNTYSYDLKNKKLKLAKRDCTVIQSSGAYCLCELAYRSDVSPYPLAIYKLTASGKMKLVKKLGGCCYGGCKAGGKFYYVEYEDEMMTKASLYRCDYDGTDLEKLGTFKAKNGGAIYLQTITSTYCEYIEMDSDGTNETNRYDYK